MALLESVLIPLGTTMPDFELKDPTDKLYKGSDLYGDEKHRGLLIGCDLRVIHSACEIGQGWGEAGRQPLRQRLDSKAERHRRRLRSGNYIRCPRREQRSRHVMPAKCAPTSLLGSHIGRVSCYSLDQAGRLRPSVATARTPVRPTRVDRRGADRKCGEVPTDAGRSSITYRRAGRIGV